MDRPSALSFEERVAAVLDGTATEAERAEFGRLLDGQPEYVDEYVRQARMHVMLEACAGLRGQESGVWGQESGEGARFSPGRARVVASHWWKVAVAAGVLLTGAAAWRGWPPASPATGVPGNPADAQVACVAAPVATVRTSLHGQWADGRKVTAGTVLTAGVWAWQCGLVELVTLSDTVLLVEAPASLEIVDALHARLLTGKLVVRMPKGCSGFVVDTPELRVLDLGTEFGVSVSPAGESQVQVFEGSVRAETSGSEARKELRAGQTLRTTTGGRMVAAEYEEARFIRRMPPMRASRESGGVLYSTSGVHTVYVAYAVKPVVADGDLEEWDRQKAFRNACLPPYAETYYLEGLMMYDAENLYLAAHVGDPEPLCNAAPQGFEFAGGSVIVRVSTDRALGWPLKGTLVEAGPSSYRKRRLSPDATSDRIASLILWHDASAGRPRLKLQRGIDLHDEQVDPEGWQGILRKDASGRGYTLEYVIPWRLLKSAVHPPQPGDTLAALWTAHWSDEEGRLARGQLVEVTNPQPHPGQGLLQPQTYYQNGPSWGKAVYLPKGGQTK